MAVVNTGTGTYLKNLFVPQVIGGLVEKKLVDAMKFAPLCRVDNSLQGRPGNEITLPSFSYIGDAKTVAEGADIEIAQLTASTVKATIHKVGKGVQITDEAVLSAYGDPVGEAARQLGISIASQIDNEVFNTLKNATLKKELSAALKPDDIADALVSFGEDIDGEKVIIVSPQVYSVIRKANVWVPASEIAANMILKGTVGEIHGCQVVVSNKCKEQTVTSTGTTYESPIFIVKPGALALYLKRDILVETDRDIINKSTVITADKHFVSYLYDPSKAIYINQKLSAASEGK